MCVAGGDSDSSDDDFREATPRFQHGRPGEQVRQRGWRQRCPPPRKISKPCQLADAPATGLTHSSTSPSWADSPLVLEAHRKLQVCAVLPRLPRSAAPHRRRSSYGVPLAFAGQQAFLHLDCCCGAAASGSAVPCSGHGTAEDRQGRGWSSLQTCAIIGSPPPLTPLAPCN